MGKRLVTAMVGVLFSSAIIAQDPHFSQFFNSPLTVSPAMTANTDADWRVAANFRQQWASPAAPYNTGTISYDARMFKEQTGNSILGAGIMLLYDESFYRIVKSTYVSANLAYHQQLDADDFHHIGLGFSATYGKRGISFDELTWEDQFTSSGFNTSLPTGEQNLSDTKGYLSLSTGLLYSMVNETTNIEIGCAYFHLNKPKQTFLADERQIVPPRYVIHASFDQLLSEKWFINASAVYQSQSNLEFWLVGGSVGTMLSGDENTFINLGVWYRHRDAFIPVICMYKNGWQLALSYDVTTSKLIYAKPPKSWEISFSYRMKTNNGDRSSRCPVSFR